jgi:hypothetical protein
VLCQLCGCISVHNTALPDRFVYWIPNRLVNGLTNSANAEGLGNKVALAALGGFATHTYIIEIGVRRSRYREVGNTSSALPRDRMNVRRSNFLSITLSPVDCT